MNITTVQDCFIKWYTNVAYDCDYVVAGFTSEFDNRAKNRILNGVWDSIQPSTLDWEYFIRMIWLLQVISLSFLFVLFFFFFK